MVNDLHNTQNKKPKNSLFKSKSLDHLSDTSVNLINHPTCITSPPPIYTKRPNKLHLPKFKLFPKRYYFSHPKTTPQTTTLPFSPDQHPSLPHYSNNHPIRMTIWLLHMTLQLIFLSLLIRIHPLKSLHA